MKIQIAHYSCITILICLMSLCLFTCPCMAHTYAVGADLSFMKQAEDNGFKFKEAGKEKPGLSLFKDHGYNWIRLRLFYTPTRLPNDLAYTIALAREAKAMGYKFLLDLRECLNYSAVKYQKDIIVVEAAYNFKPREYVNKKAPFVESPEGQKEYLEQVNQIVLNVPGGRGCGVFWWEPAAPGRGSSSRDFFDKEGNVLPVINVFDKYTRK